MQSTLAEEKKSKESELLQLVGFKLGAEEYGIDILLVQEINRMLGITKVPRSPDYVKGVINLRGRIIPIISLRKRFNLPEKETDKSTRIIVADIGGRVVGMVVDSVNEVLRLPKDTVEPPPPLVAGAHSDYINGVGKLKDRLLILLDLTKLLSAEEKDLLGDIKT